MKGTIFNLVKGRSSCRFGECIMNKLLIILIGIIVLQNSYSQEFLIYDSLFVITEDYKGFRYFQPFKEAGADWTEPYDLYRGDFHLRYEIFDYKAQDSMVFNLCIWSDVDESVNNRIL